MLLAFSLSSLHKSTSVIRLLALSLFFPILTFPSQTAPVWISFSSEVCGRLMRRVLQVCRLVGVGKFEDNSQILCSFFCVC